MREVVEVKMSHDFDTFDEVTQQRLLAEYGEYPVEALEGPISYRGDYLSRLMDEIKDEDSTARMGQPHNGRTYEQMQQDRPVRIFTRLSSGKLNLLKDAVLGYDEQLEEVS